MGAALRASAFFRQKPLTLRKQSKLLIAAFLLLGPAVAWLALALIPPPLLANRADMSCAVSGRDGKLLRLSLTGDGKYRLWTPLQSMPEALTQATLAYEDRRFFQHPGVDPLALGRAAWSSFIAQDRWIGASTVTMQLARQRFRLKTRTVSGKLRQIGYALWLERHFSKAELLEAYLNLAPYGANIEGAGAAAWIYFHKPLAQLSADEARALVLIPQNPRHRAPLSEDGKQALGQAWRLAYGDDPGFARLGFWRREELPLRAPHFAERVCGLTGEARNLASTLDPAAQSLAETLLDSFVRRHEAQGIRNAAVMLVHAPHMEVLAYAGSAAYADARIQGFVNGLKARRSPGSALKPFVYALAIAQGLITPDTLLKDTPLRVGDYQPENFERNYYGPLSATEALVRSRNIPAVALAAQLRQPDFYAFLQQAGLRLPKQAADYGLSLAMGGAEVSMEELLRLYGLLANGGQYYPLRWLRTDAAGPAPASLLSPEAAFLARQMLEANPPPQRGFGTRPFSGQTPVAWKTGTSSGLKDAWAVGLMGDLLAGVWVGNFDGTPNRHLVGRDLAGPLLFGLLEAVGQEFPVDTRRPQPPPGLKQVEICPLSGALRSPWCPHGKTGWIIPGVSPLKACAVHRPVHINPANGLRLCPGDEHLGQAEIAEFWDSDVLALYRLAGLRRDPPPPFEKPCAGLPAADSAARPPAIVSPQPGLSYPVRADGGSRIEFSSVSDGGRRVFWFVDDTYVGEGSSIVWPAKPGRFEVRAVDEQGQSAAVPLTAVVAE